MAEHTSPGESELSAVPGLSRRTFLHKSLMGAILLGAAGLVARCTRRIAPKVTGYLALDAAEFRTLVAFSVAVLPEPSTAAVVATPFRVDLEVSRWSVKNQVQVRHVLDLMENGTRYFLFSWRSFSDLPLSERRAYLRQWEGSRFAFRREAYQALRMMAFFFYYSQDSTWKAIGYDGPWIKAAPVATPSATSGA